MGAGGRHNVGAGVPHTVPRIFARVPRPLCLSPTLGPPALLAGAWWWECWNVEDYQQVYRGAE